MHSVVVAAIVLAAVADVSTAQCVQFWYATPTPRVWNPHGLCDHHS